MARTRWNSPGEVPWRSQRTAEMLKQFDFCWTPTPGGRIEIWRSARKPNFGIGKRPGKAALQSSASNFLPSCHLLLPCLSSNLSHYKPFLHVLLCRNGGESFDDLNELLSSRKIRYWHEQVGCDWGRLCTGSLSDCTFCRLYMRLTARFLDLSCQHGVECLWRASFEERQLQICRSKWKGGACRDLSAARNWRCLARDSLAQRCSVRFQRIRRAAEFVESDDFGTSLPNDW